MSELWGWSKEYEYQVVGLISYSNPPLSAQIEIVRILDSFKELQQILHRNLQQRLQPANSSFLIIEKNSLHLMKMWN